MKKSLLFKFTALSLFMFFGMSMVNAQQKSTSAAADLFFSEYIEGSGNTKALEIFNGTGSDVDLSAYSIVGAYNDGGWSTDVAFILELSGTLASGEVYVVANGEAIQGVLDVADITFLYGTGPGEKVCTFNGNDARGLFKNGVLIDVIGAPTEAVTSWAVAGVAGATAEHTLIRKATVSEGNLDWTASAGTNVDDSEWVVYAQNYIADLGMHTFSDGPTGTISLSNSEMSVYPNPSNGKFFVEMGSAFKANTKVEVYNVIGMKVFETLTSDFKTQINISAMKQGVYFVKVDDGTNIYTQKVMKQ